MRERSRSSALLLCPLEGAHAVPARWVSYSSSLLSQALLQSHPPGSPRRSPNLVNERRTRHEAEDGESNVDGEEIAVQRCLDKDLSQKVSEHQLQTSSGDPPSSRRGARWRVRRCRRGSWRYRRRFQTFGSQRSGSVSQKSGQRRASQGGAGTSVAHLGESVRNRGVCSIR